MFMCTPLHPLISLFVINLAHAHKRFRTATSAFLSNVYLNNTSVNMSKRESLNKLRVNCLKELAKDQGIDVKKKKKEDLISDILTCQLPAAVLTPVIAKSVPEECVSPSAVEIENLPPYNAVRYTDNFTGNIPTISFSDIYNSYMPTIPIFAGFSRFDVVKNTNPDIPIGIVKIPRNPDSQKI